MSESIITALFACPLDSTSSSANGPSASASRPPPRLAEFVAYALHRTRLPDIITFQALFLLRRLKSRFPAARGSSGHRLFISALMLASKSSCDDTYSNKSWTIVCQGLFSFREVNQMERELFGYLDFRVNVEMDELSLFRTLLIAGDFGAIVDCYTTQSRPNPSITSSPAMDRECDTPKASKTAAGNYSNSLDRQHPYQSTAASFSRFSTNLSPSNVSVSSSGRGSISSASGYSMTPSPSSVSPSEASSSRTTPDTPPQELCSSPWSEVDTKAASSYRGEPAGTYDEHVDFYQQLKNLQYYGQQPHIYNSSAVPGTIRQRHPFQ